MTIVSDIARPTSGSKPRWAGSYQCHPSRLLDPLARTGAGKVYFHDF